MKARDLVHQLLEAEGEEDLSVEQILADLENATPEFKGTVQKVRKTRMKIADFGRYVFCISYITPVAYEDKETNGFYKTSKQWSPTTNGHIWEFASVIHKRPEWQADERNWEPGDKWNPGGHYVRMPRFIRVPQEEISDKFREIFSTLKMGVKDKRKLYAVPKHFRADYEGAGHKTGWGSYANLLRSKHEMPDDFEARKLNPKFFDDFEPPEPEQGINVD